MDDKKKALIQLEENRRKADSEMRRRRERTIYLKAKLLAMRDAIAAGDYREADKP